MKTIADFKSLADYRKNYLRPYMSQQGIATRLDLKHQTMVSNVENGLRVPDKDVAAWADAYGLSVSEFLRMQAGMSPQQWLLSGRAQSDFSHTRETPSTGLASALATTA